MPVLLSSPGLGLDNSPNSLTLGPEEGQVITCPFSAPRHAGPDGPPPADNVEVTRCLICLRQQYSMRCAPEIGPDWSTVPSREDSWRVNGSIWPDTARIEFISFALALSR